MNDLSALHKRYYAGKKVVVTGGAGFIGSNLVDHLVLHGAHVTVLDNLSTGRIDNLAASAAHITFVYGDITQPHTCRKALTGASHLFHLAAYTSVPGSITDPERCHKINVTGTETLYHEAITAQIKHIIFASSAAVYGPQETPCDEQDPVAPASPYAVSKHIGEQLGIILAQQHPSVSVANLRYFNVYGDRQRSDQFGGVVALFKKNIENGTPITIYGDGTQTRDFIPVDQIIEATLQAGLCSPLKGHIINVATGHSTSLLELIKTLSRENATIPQIIHTTTRPGDIQHSHAQIKKLLRLNTFSPFTPSE